MTDDPSLDDPEALTEIAIHAFARTTKQAIAENDRRGVPSYGSKDGKIVVRQPRAQGETMTDAEIRRAMRYLLCRSCGTLHLGTPVATTDLCANCQGSKFRLASIEMVTQPIPSVRWPRPFSAEDIEMIRARRKRWSGEAMTGATDPSRPNVHRLVYLAVQEILADDSPDPVEVAHRDWLKSRLDEQGRRIAGRFRGMPNRETIEAMKAAERGEVTTVGHPRKLLKSLNADC